MRILVDMDDTIVDLLNTWIEVLNSNYGLSVERNQITEWDMQKNFPMLRRDEIYSPLFDRDFWKQVRPLPGARENLEKLMVDGHEVYIVTSSHYATLQAKLDDCLFRYFPFIGYDNVIVTSRKDLIVGDVLVDDNPANLISNPRLGFLIDAPYNRKLDAIRYGLIRVTDWHDIYQMITNVSNFFKKEEQAIEG